MILQSYFMADFGIMLVIDILRKVKYSMKDNKCIKRLDQPNMNQVAELMKGIGEELNILAEQNEENKPRLVKIISLLNSLSTNYASKWAFMQDRENIDIQSLCVKLEDLYPQMAAYDSRANMFKKAVEDRYITRETCEKAEKYYGDKWTELLI